MQEEILRFEHIDKRFMGVHALKDISFGLYKGEIHALMGENGAGKSTLMKILTSIYSKDSGAIYFQGQPFNPKHPKEALDSGISIIHFYQYSGCLLLHWFPGHRRHLCDYRRGHRPVLRPE